jgi:hypothetical protein
MNPIEIFYRDVANTELREAALAQLEYVLAELATKEVADDGSSTYDDEKGTAERYMLGGGGPSWWAVFVQFAIDDVTGYLEYADSTGTTIVHIPSVVAVELRAVLRRDAKARNAR